MTVKRTRQLMVVALDIFKRWKTVRLKDKYLWWDYKIDFRRGTYIAEILLVVFWYFRIYELQIKKKRLDLGKIDEILQVFLIRISKFMRERLKFNFWSDIPIVNLAHDLIFDFQENT